MAYATEAQVEAVTGPIETADFNAALALAQGFIDAYCNTTFDAPASESTYIIPGNGTPYLFAPAAGQFGAVSKIEVYEGGGIWTKVDSDFLIFPEYVELEDVVASDGWRYRVTGKLYTTLTAALRTLLEKATIGICKLILVPHDEPTGRSLVNMSMEGVSMTYQRIDLAHPTGNEEIDFCLRTLRREVKKA